MNRHPSYLAMLLPALLVTGCVPAATVVVAPPPALPDTPPRPPEIRDYLGTNGKTLPGSTAPGDAERRDASLLASASHDLACPHEAVRPIEWVPPSRTSEYAF